MSIRRLRKSFGQKVALDDMTLDVYEGEIFALLGHNGAGKTTAINCIVGMLSPTRGTVVVNGCDVATEPGLARRQLSMCPQDNPIFDVFTVHQHLSFFASLRGVPPEAVRGRAKEALVALGMLDKLGDLCSSLSGGQKRRLWIATALLGATPLALLDEPTSGMDPSARRELWDTFLALRAAGRCVVFTTHYLEEADILADRKAVMARGKVQAVGTSIDLKQHFGLGYHLRVEMTANTAECDVERLTELVKEHVPSGHKVQDLLPERAHARSLARIEKFVLPYKDAGCFGPLLLALDAQRAALQIASYSTAMTSLEEVFMSIGRQADQEAASDGSAAKPRSGSKVEHVGKARASIFASSKTMALVRIRLLQILMDRRSFFTAVVLPILLNSYGLLAWSDQQSNLFSLAMFVPTAFGISTLVYAQALIRDRQARCKYVAISQGLPFKSYWFGTFFAHYVCMLPVTLIVACMIWRAQLRGLGGEVLLMVLAQCAVYPVGLIFFSYNMSLLFQTTEVAAKVMPLSITLFALLPTGIVAVCWQFSEWRSLAQATHVLMSVVNPLYGLPGMLVLLGLSKIVPDIVEASYFLSWCGIPLYGSAISILLFVGNLALKELRSYSAAPGHAARFTNSKDDDVLAEEACVERTMRNGPDPENPIGMAACVQGLMHTYRTKVNGVWKETHALRGISFGVREGESFGLLGPNGAGKTTTLAVLTALVRPPSAGVVKLLGRSMASGAERSKAFRHLGICPQEDPLWENVSGREHLLFYGSVKGVPASALDSTVDALLSRLGIDHADAMRPTGQYSGGMKRKLSLAIALIAQPPLLFLDEPSAAVDAAAKRQLWSLIQGRARGQSLVVTTHSMEEAEALCDRVAIQVRGQLRCLGAPHHIKHKYGSGYRLEVLCQTAAGHGCISGCISGQTQREHLVAFVREKLSSQASLSEQHAGRYLFQLPPMRDAPGALTLGRVFTVMQESKERFGIIDFSLSQPSLEQVFLRFAREQESLEEFQPQGPEHKLGMQGDHCV